MEKAKQTSESKQYKDTYAHGHTTLESRFYCNLSVILERIQNLNARIHGPCGTMVSKASTLLDLDILVR